MADNSAGFNALDEELERLRALEHMNEDAAKDVAVGFKSKVVSNVAAQLDPYGHPWHESKDGLPLLVNAAQAVTSEADGTKVVMTVSSIENRHHVGSAKGYRGGSSKLGGFRRPIIPFSKLPGPFKAVCREVLVKRFTRSTGGT